MQSEYMFKLLLQTRKYEETNVGENKDGDPARRETVDLPAEADKSEKQSLATQALNLQGSIVHTNQSAIFQKYWRT